MADGIPHLAFESAEAPPGEGRARWQALVEAYEVSLPEAGAEADFAVSSQSWLVGEVVITHGRLTPVRLTRDAARIAERVARRVRESQDVTSAVPEASAERALA